MTEPYKPSWRKPAGIFLILGLITIWAVLIGSASGQIGRLPGWAQIPVYLVSGIIWILPLKPLLLWMETGRWRVRSFLCATRGVRRSAPTDFISITDQHPPERPDIGSRPAR